MQDLQKVQLFPIPFSLFLNLEQGMEMQIIVMEKEVVVKDRGQLASKGERGREEGREGEVERGGEGRGRRKGIRRKKVESKERGLEIIHCSSQVSSLIRLWRTV